MEYGVELAARAARDLEILYLEKNAAESPDAARWYNGLEQAVYTLETHPNRCPSAPEARKVKRQLRHLLYGAKPHVYRVILERSRDAGLIPQRRLRRPRAHKK
jgi:hypothetical protein